MTLPRLTIWQWEEISRHDDEPYLVRLIVVRYIIGLMIHWFVGSDDECLHLHPWGFVTFIVRGGYWEWVPANVQKARDGDRYMTAPDGIELRGRWYGPGSILFRRASWLHRVEYVPERPAITMVLHGPKTREWGFATPKGFIHHRDYSYKQHCSA